ncbi:hypothetical protein [Thalassospira tepidiphila]|uniref:hypothetical protein n=1 Tax=Thalassospira tepidiphila TaxID=393657 RepID=UPI003AA7BD61
METQKASKGELLSQFVYATAAAVGFAYVSVLFFALATGNRKPVAEHPGLTALLCLLSSITLVNLCRHQSARFWKIADLVWIVTFVPSLAGTVYLHNQSMAVAEYDEKLSDAYEYVSNYKGFWENFVVNQCSLPNFNYPESCQTVSKFNAVMSRSSKDIETFKRSIEGPTSIATKSQFTYILRPGSLSEFLQSLDNIPSPFQEKITAYLEKHPYPMGQVEVAMLARMMTDFKDPEDEKRVIADLASVALMIETIMISNHKWFNLRRYYHERIRGPWKIMRIIPLLIACFVFPFRVGKSIYEISAKKQSKNAPQEAHH